MRLGIRIVCTIHELVIDERLHILDPLMNMVCEYGCMRMPKVILHACNDNLMNCLFDECF